MNQINSLIELFENPELAATRPTINIEVAVKKIFPAKWQTTSSGTRQIQFITVTPPDNPQLSAPAYVVQKPFLTQNMTGEKITITGKVYPSSDRNGFTIYISKWQTTQIPVQQILTKIYSEIHVIKNMIEGLAKMTFTISRKAATDNAVGAKEGVKPNVGKPIAQEKPEDGVDFGDIPDFSEEDEVEEGGEI